MMPIDTAPRDGSLIIVSDAAGMKWYSRWMTDENRWYPPLRLIPDPPLSSAYFSDHPSPSQELAHEEPVAWEMPPPAVRAP